MAGTEQGSKVKGWGPAGPPQPPPQCLEALHLLAPRGGRRGGVQEGSSWALPEGQLEECGACPGLVSLALGADREAGPYVWLESGPEMVFFSSFVLPPPLKRKTKSRPTAEHHGAKPDRACGRASPLARG